jgi:hypothetical protein
MYSSGQDVVPVYEGWEQNADGSFTMLFGYFNRNWTEELDVPPGPDNHVEPGAPDQGQPTHFYPRRSRFQFKVVVPKDFGKQEVVWTLNTHGKTEKTYGTLLPDYFIDDIVIMNNNGAGGSGGGGNNINGNKPPTLTVEGDRTRTVKVGQALTLSAVAVDEDGVPKRRVVHSNRPTASTGAEGGSGGVPATIGSRCCPDAASGLRLAWFVYRGIAANVTFDPPQYEVWEDYRDSQNSPYSEAWETPPIPPGNRWTVHATFTKPGTYVLRCQAHDGGLAKEEDITFVVR